jgi:hypothetical protein
VTFIWQSSISIDVYADRLHHRSSLPYSTLQQQRLQEETKKKNQNFNLINNTKYDDDDNEDNTVVVADGYFYRKPKSQSTSSSPRNSWFVNKEEEDDDSSSIRSTKRYNNYINTIDDVFYERQPQQQHQQRTVKDFSTRDSRIGFIRKVYAIFTTQIFITICITYMIINNLNIQNFLLSYPKELLIFNMISSIGTITAFSTTPSLRYNMPWNFILLGILYSIIFN